MANPFVHVELNTSDPAAAKKFYSGLFGWKLQDMPMGPGQIYTMIDVGKGTGGGIQQKPMPEAPTMWLSYVQVDDVKQTIAKARELGAEVFLEYMEVPGYGALGVFADPAGAALGLWQPFRRQPAAKKKAAKKKKVAKKKAGKRKSRRR
jgi:hypothetical protein